MKNISVCVITKNEENNIEKCLEPLSHYGLEIIVLDTGSTDRTVEIAQKYATRVEEFQWINDFSAARNYSISLANNDWILVMDADEFIYEMDISKLKQIADGPEYLLGNINRKNSYQNNGTEMVYTDLVPRFFNRKIYHYEGAIHEQVIPYKTDIEVRGNVERDTGIWCYHSGYSGNKEQMAQKNKRNEEILLSELKKKPDDPYLYFQLGQCFNDTDDLKALGYYSKGLEYDLDPSLEYVQMMVIAYGYCLVHLGRFEEAHDLIGIYDEFATSADFIDLIGIIYMRSGEYLLAMKEFLKASMHPVARVEGANSFIPYFNMAYINEMLGDKASAMALYAKCGQYEPAIKRLKELQNA